MAENITVNIRWEDMEHHASSERTITFIEDTADSRGPEYMTSAITETTNATRERKRAGF